jgi:hypothetical protein
MSSVGNLLRLVRETETELGKLEGVFRKAIGQADKVVDV